MSWLFNSLFFCFGLLLNSLPSNTTVNDKVNYSFELENGLRVVSVLKRNNHIVKGIPLELFIQLKDGDQVLDEIGFDGSLAGVFQVSDNQFIVNQEPFYAHLIRVKDEKLSVVSNKSYEFLKLHSSGTDLKQNFILAFNDLLIYYKEYNLGKFQLVLEAVDEKIILEMKTHHPPKAGHSVVYPPFEAVRVFEGNIYVLNAIDKKLSIFNESLTKSKLVDLSFMDDDIIFGKENFQLAIISQKNSQAGKVHVLAFNNEWD